MFSALTEHPELSGADLYRMGLTNSDRSARRYRGYFESGVAVPYSGDEEVPSYQLTTLYEQEEEQEYDLWKIIEESHKKVRIAQRKDPILTHDVLTFPDAPVAVMFVSCMHFGGRYTAHKEVADLIKRALEIPNLYIAFLGDDVENFLPQFKDKSSVEDQLYDTNVQIDIVKILLQMVLDCNKLLFGVAGQHGGWWMDSATGKNPIKEFYVKNKRPFFDGQAYIKFQVGEQTYNVAAAHKFKGSSELNPLHPQAKALRSSFPMADIVVMGDKHHFDVMETAVYGWEEEAGNRQTDRALLLQVGTGKTGPDPYTIRGWSKGRLGWPIVMLRNDEHFVKWSWDLNDIEYWLSED